MPNFAHKGESLQAARTHLNRAVRSTNFLVVCAYVADGDIQFTADTWQFSHDDIDSVLKLLEADKQRRIAADKIAQPVNAIATAVVPDTDW
jgi:glucokinase